MEEKFDNVPKMSYNNKCGIYESNSRILYGSLPNKGISDNKYLACYSIMRKIYSDAYSRSWGIRSRLLTGKEKLEDLYKQHVRPIMGARFGKFDKFYTDGEYLEDCMNKVIKVLIKTEDFQFERQVFILERNTGSIHDIRASKFTTFYFRDIRESKTKRVTFKTYSSAVRYTKSEGILLEKI